MPKISHSPSSVLFYCITVHQINFLGITCIILTFSFCLFHEIHKLPSALVVFPNNSKELKSFPWKLTLMIKSLSKIIGARYYHSEERYYDTDIKSPQVSEGHGFHTASMAAGREVAGSSYYSLAEGVARGCAPNARVAVHSLLEVRMCTGRCSRRFWWCNSWRSR